MRKLGKGLSELGLAELLKAPSSSNSPPHEANGYEKITYLSVRSLVPGEYQPRRYIDQTALAELADSIRTQGILQPLIVRQKSDQQYEIIAGERRWRAAQMAGLQLVPAVIREISDQTAVAFGLIENIQRRDLTALEEAQGLHRLLSEFHLTHEEVAQAVGKSRTVVTNLLRLLQLNPDVKDLLLEGLLEKGHALVLLSLEGVAQSQCAQIVVAKKLSVRQTETLIRQQREKTTLTSAPSIRPVYALESQQRLAEKLGAKVRIRHNIHGKGKIVIHYEGLEELNKILNQI